MNDIASGSVVELLRDWEGCPIEPPMDNRIKLTAGTRLRVFTQVGTIVEVFIQGQAVIYRIPAHMLRRCN